MVADYFFRMGSTHAICQDYAIAGDVDGYQYALLSDGCSGVALPGLPGSPFTDFGARFLVRAARQHMDDLARGVFPGCVIVERAAKMAEGAGLPPMALDATLLTAVTTSNGDVVTSQTGDGVLAVRRRDGSIKYRTLTFGNGMPLYLSYQLDPRRMETLLHPERSGRAVTPEECEAAGTVAILERIFVPGEGWREPTTKVERFDESTRGLWTEVFYKDECDLVLIMSDGVETFQTKNTTLMPLEQVLEQLFDFKGFAGQFLVRRCTRFLQKFCTEYGWSHSDDFSVAGIHLGEP
jgi:hypothetical protein